MELLVIATFLSLVNTAYAGSHSFWYFITLTAGPSPFPEIMLLGMVDDVLVEYYDSVDRVLVSRRHWHQDGNVPEAELKRRAIPYNIHSFRNKLYRMMSHFNNSAGLQTYQRIAGCELDDDGTERFHAKDAYNGKDVLLFHPNSYTWSCLVPEMDNDEHWLMQFSKGAWHELYGPVCISGLKTYLHQDMNVLKRRVRPRLRVLQKLVGGAGGAEVTCLATGFYPRHIELTLQRDGRPIPDQDMTIGDTLPNGDGTYQLRRSLSVSAEEPSQRHVYTCTIRHVSVDNKLDITWESQPGPNVALILGASLTPLIAVLLIVVIGVLTWRRRRSREPGCHSATKNEEEMERINAAAGADRDGEGGVEREGMERVSAS
ncbi:hypothetical protein AAFF_G00276080 [Aldrovandia affinis]|uniref:Ig-like domain-containing protein n=1 Tax=Aldrovandia affinis TaxID=143900 RepID=A0AAD7RAK3_9TELE|nr:hypothetical protein AAFF_G00276080 [Aldrovandia affinis]